MQFSLLKQPGGWLLGGTDNSHATVSSYCMLMSFIIRLQGLVNSLPTSLIRECPAPA